MRRLTILSVLICVAVTAPVTMPNRPEWFDRVNVFHGGPIATAPFSGVVWGTSPHTDKESFIRDAEFWGQERKPYHGEGTVRELLAGGAN